MQILIEIPHPEEVGDIYDHIYIPLYCAFLQSGKYRIFERDNVLIDLVFPAGENGGCPEVRIMFSSEDFLG